MANKKRKCLHCKEYSPVEDGIRTPVGFFCNHDHALAYSRAKRQRAIQRQQKKEQKNKKAADRQIKRECLSWQHQHTQKAFNRMRVLEELLWFKERGREPECISCGKPLGGDQWCCGHFKTRGAHPELRYDPLNTFLQHNHRCNMNLSGDIEGTKTTRGYKSGLIERFGEIDGHSIINYCECKRPARKWTWQELEEMRKSFNKRIRELEAQL